MVSSSVRIRRRALTASCSSACPGDGFRTSPHRTSPHRTSPHTPMVWPAGSLIAGATWFGLHWSGSLVTAPHGSAVMMTLLVAIGVSAARVDVRQGVIPDRLVVASAVVVVAGAAAAVTSEGFAPVVAGGGLGTVALGGPLLLAHLISPSGLGFGDVKLGAVHGAALGVVDPMSALVALTIASGCAAAAGTVTGRHAVAFGPGLVAGTLLACTVPIGWSA